MRGGRRRRYVNPEQVPVTCAGRWGPKRARVTQCWEVLTAESVYTDLLRDDPARMSAGVNGSLEWALPGRSEPASVEWELRPNAVWRFWPTIPAVS
jgi:hypothetical protein